MEENEIPVVDCSIELTEYDYHVEIKVGELPIKFRFDAWSFRQIVRTLQRDYDY